MKILLANGTAFPDIGGVENSLNYISQALISQGHEVKIFCFKRKPEEPLRCIHNNVEIIREPCKSSKLPFLNIQHAVEASRRGVKKILEEFYPDMIWCRRASVAYGISQTNYSGQLVNIFPTTAKMDADGLYGNTKGLPIWRKLALSILKPFAYYSALRLETKLLKKCRPIVFSNLMNMQLTSRHLLPKGAIRTVRPGVDQQIFSKENAKKIAPTIVKEYGLKNEKYVLYVGRLSAAKNVYMLFDAMTEVDNEAKLVVVGSGAERQRLEEYAKEKNINESVIFVGTQSEALPAFYALSTVCVLPTTVESFGQTYLESMACGTPVVGFRSDQKKILTATQEIVKHEETGVIVDEINSSALALAVNSVLALSNDNYMKMSEQAISDMKKRFSWSNFVVELLDDRKY